MCESQASVSVVLRGRTSFKVEMAQPKEDGGASCEPSWATKINESWSMDFVSDGPFNGHRFRSLKIVDNFSWECPLIWVDQSIKGENAVQMIRRICFQRGGPGRIFLDNGPEFVGKALDKWAL